MSLKLGFKKKTRFFFSKVLQKSKKRQKHDQKMLFFAVFLLFLAVLCNFSFSVTRKLQIFFNFRKKKWKILLHI